MPYQSNPRTATTRHQPPMDAAGFDAQLLDDDNDDFLDHHVAAIRESLAGFHDMEAL